MSRVLGLASLFVVIGGAQATSLAQDCGQTGFFVAAAAVTGLAVYDIATAPASARRYNQRHVVILPHVDTRHRSYGLSVSWSFGRSPPISREPVGSSAASSVSFAPARKSPGTALALSLASTAVPMIAGAAAGNDVGAWTFVGGFVIGPSVGHFYAGQVARGLGTIALRGAGTVLGLASILGCID